ncbi:hypothetical protein POPTR_004G226200v4 [Populus trichocarpa]|uniref:Uncharacterized protein n=1 Tax=Populus trichocarpa TaxID=3694 RepID=U5GH71_POPTR|nr:hypothetical protein POPTR_004G226200v4 [Populus trichocarpa]
MSDIDCNFGNCDCDCDPDCCCCCLDFDLCSDGCCCCCPDFHQCFDGCCSSDGDHSLCCCLICIGSSDRHRNHRDSGGVPWLCCWDCGSRRRRTSSSEGQWRPDPKQNGTKKEEKEKKKETGTCCSSHGPFDISPRYKHQHDSSDWNKTKHQCSRCSSIPPSPLDPPRIQQFGRLDHEKRVIGHGMYY